MSAQLKEIESDEPWVQGEEADVSTDYSRKLGQALFTLNAGFTRELLPPYSAYWGVLESKLSVYAVNGRIRPPFTTSHNSTGAEKRMYAKFISDQITAGIDFQSTGNSDYWDNVILNLGKIISGEVVQRGSGT